MGAGLVNSVKGVQLFIGTKNGLFRYDSDASRTHWQLSGPFLPGWTISALYVDTGPRGLLFAATSHLAYGPSIRVSEDAGQSWHELLDSPRYGTGQNRTVNQIWRIVAAGSGESNTYYAGVDDAGLFRSADGGQAWHEVAPLSRHLDEALPHLDRSGVVLDSIVVDPASPHTLWVGVRRTGLFRSTDAGESWAACHTGLPPLVMLSGDPLRTNVLYAQTTAGLFGSRDGGHTWQRADHGLPGSFSFCLHVARNGDVYSVPLESQTQRHVKGGRLRVYRSSDAGQTWVSCSRGLPRHPYYAGVLRDGLDTDDLSPTGVYLGTTAGEVFVSRDGSETWEQLPESFARITTVRVRVLQ